MTSPLLAALRAARDLVASATVEAGDAAVARRILGDLDETIARLAGDDPDKDLLSIVCHDLKDPLASIVMGAGFLKKTLPSEDASSRRVVDAIGRSADRMANVVGDFHDLARLEAGRMELDRRPCDVVGALESGKPSFEAQASPHGIRLELDLPRGPI
ncbi:MAG TPA: histidine kinase dimerization/phospho-acceptor domain-containing protein, partial [Polyangiaceae bacterium]|nr:histidine kinase dimerization/phospho-acceptor domain-containing protein [Polyangiaceae bacterium]